MDGLNEVRPLVIGEKVDNVFDIPVLDSNPVNSNKLAKGKLLRCDNNGALLKCNQIEAEFDDVITFELMPSSPHQKLRFPRPVNRILFYRISGDDDVALAWITWQGIRYYGQQDPLVSWLIEYACTQMRVRGTGVGDWSMTVGCAFTYRR